MVVQLQAHFQAHSMVRMKKKRIHLPYQDIYYQICTQLPFHQYIFT